uniref:Uncharacterized protein n=1 Tax=Cacopsylla melanoneura TaxID=428564 RepID=A0A8D8SWU7_9HEMI
MFCKKCQILRKGRLFYLCIRLISILYMYSPTSYHVSKLLSELVCHYVHNGTLQTISIIKVPYYLYYVKFIVCTVLFLTTYFTRSFLFYETILFNFLVLLQIFYLLVVCF